MNLFKFLYGKKSLSKTEAATKNRVARSNDTAMPKSRSTYERAEVQASRHAWYEPQGEAADLERFCRSRFGMF